MISFEDARSMVLAGLAPVPAERICLTQGAGRVLAEDLSARVSHPPVAVSAMDGYAVRAADAARACATLVVVGESAAGHPFGGVMGAGEAVRIFTGAALPAGADSIAIQEDCRREVDRVTVSVAVAPGTFVRPAGLDFKQGEVLLRAGTVLNGPAIGLAAAMNIPWLAVRRRPRIAVLSTGDEIAMPGDPLGPAHIPGSNGPGLSAFIQGEGAEALHLGVARDSRDSLDAMIAAARGCDLLVTTGGASVGDYDLVKDALAAAGLRLGFHKVAMRPGKPLMFGEVRGCPVLGLAGNPVAAMVGAVLLLRPMIRALLGLATETETVPVRLGRDLPANDLRQDYLRSDLARTDDGAWVATPFPVQDSAVLSGMARARCLVVRPPFAEPAKAGDVLPAVLL